MANAQTWYIKQQTRTSWSRHMSQSYINQTSNAVRRWPGAGEFKISGRRVSMKCCRKIPTNRVLENRRRQLVLLKVVHKDTYAVITKAWCCVDEELKDLMFIHERRGQESFSSLLFVVLVNESACKRPREFYCYKDWRRTSVGVGQSPWTMKPWALMSTIRGRRNRDGDVDDGVLNWY